MATDKDVTQTNNRKGMKIYILVGIYTPNEMGSTGNICDCLIFDSKEKAIERLRAEIKGDTDRNIEIEKTNIGDEQGRIIAECDYTADWTSDYLQYEIREIDTNEIGLTIK